MDIEIQMDDYTAAAVETPTDIISAHIPEKYSIHISVKHGALPMVI